MEHQKQSKEEYQLLKKFYQTQNKIQRENVNISNLTLGLQCGGSDGYSGLTANPSLGHAVDLLVQNGGTAVLSETPEIYGAEHLLTKRAITEEVGQKLVERIKWGKLHHCFGRKNGQ